MFPTLRQSILSTPKQRRRFFWVRNMATFFIGLAVFYKLPDPWGMILVLPAALLTYFTVAPVVALIVCFVEEMMS
jgi:hypothetical protein